MTFLPLWAKALILAALLAAAAWAVHTYNEWIREPERATCAAEKASDREATRKTVEAQRERNIELQRAAEKRYVVQAQVRDRYIIQTVKEIHEAAAPLAACPVPSGVRVRLNSLAACARADSTAACGADGQVPDTR